MPKKIQIPEIPAAENTPFVRELLSIINELLQKIQLQDQKIQILENEISILKKQKPRPQLLPNNLGKKTSENGSKEGLKRAGSEKRSKTAELKIHEDKIIVVEQVPPGSVRKGYQEFVVQDIKIESRNVRYLRERWLTPSGEHLVAELPKELNNSHFGPELTRFVLYQHYQNHVTRPLIHEQLKAFGIDISTGQIDAILINGKDTFHNEKDEILSVGLRHTKTIEVDDTGARHAGKNGFCTQIGSEFFTWFKSTDSKSRINFLELLRGASTSYCFNDDAFEYIEHYNFSEQIVHRLKREANRFFADKAALDLFFTNECILTITQKRIVTEALLIGTIIANGVLKELVVHSDGARQFAVLLHSLCWIHAERPFRKLIPIDEKMRAAIESIRNEIWLFYDALKAYKNNPSEQIKQLLGQRFDIIFSQQTPHSSINRILESIRKNKSDLLLVLERPYVSLQNNGSEREIREYVKRRKISGSTRSDLGRQCRDTFTSLKKTCRKLGISFWQYLLDRLTKAGSIPYLPATIIQRSAISSF